MKKIGKRGLAVFLVAAAFIFLALGCAETGPGADGAADTGSQLQVKDIDYQAAVDVLADNTATVLTIMNVSPTPTMITFTIDNVPLGTNDDSSQTGIFLESYSVDFNSDDPGAVPLSSLDHAGIAGYIAPRSSISIQEYTMVPPDIKLEYFIKKGSNPVVYNDSVQYNARITVYGVNDFGQDVQVSFQLALYFGNWED